MQTFANRRRFTIVPRRRSSRWLAAAAAVLWALSLALAATWSARRAAPELVETRAELSRAERRIDEMEQSLNEARQQSANLGRAEEITRVANIALQQDLAAAEEEMAQLRADVSFYERLVGVSGQRRGLSAHSIGFAPGANGSWSYRVTLVQNLDRGKVSRGELKLQLDGVQNGRLTSLDWDTLRQHEDAESQAFEFRYFQQIDGNVMLPKDFQPHRVRVVLRAEGRSQEQTFPWDQALNNGASAGR